MGDCYQTDSVSDSLMHRTAFAVLFFFIKHENPIRTTYVVQIMAYAIR